MWQVGGRSVRGASHAQRGLPNQDALRCHQPTNPDGCAVVAIADGHGHARYFRSHNGAKLAVKTAVTLLTSFAAEQQGMTLSTTKRLAAERLPRQLVRVWRDQVADHLARHPFREDEWQTVDARGGPGARQRIEADPQVAYGATVIAVLIGPEYLLCLQLGDGDILTVDDDGAVTRPPLPNDPRLMANQTTSLCMAEAWADVRLHFQSLADRPPRLLLLSTDGYANSFADEAGFLAVGGDLLASIAAQGIDGVQRRLGGWLTHTSQAGSGDDITLGLAYRTTDVA
ncbi:MAG: protein phosphatase 2C domain-containing protein [Caldilineaceae bacterium]|nr:protein phosphatase 2C domain-containing protein [Caldilineaceae bacterium]